MKAVFVYVCFFLFILVFALMKVFQLLPFLLSLEMVVLLFFVVMLLMLGGISLNLLLYMVVVTMESAVGLVLFVMFTSFWGKDYLDGVCVLKF